MRVGNLSINRTESLKICCVKVCNLILHVRECEAKNLMTCNLKASAISAEIEQRVKMIVEEYVVCNLILNARESILK